MAGRASIVGAAATHVGKVREHNEDAHFFDADSGVFLVCDGMGGHAAGEVASAIAIKAIRGRWTSDETLAVADGWLTRGTPDARKQLLAVIRAGVAAAHDAIIAEAVRDPDKTGMGTTLVGAIIVGGELVFAHAGDSRAYLVRDGIAMQLTEDHTLLQRLLAAGIEVDLSGEGSRFRSMLTNALGIGQECKVATFVVPLADGDRFLLCSDGITEYVPEAEIGEVLSKSPSPARAAQKLIELALDRGGGDNATAVVVRVLEAGLTPLPAEQRRRDDVAIQQCPLWGSRIDAQQRLRALRIAIGRDYHAGERLPAHTLGDRVAWIVVEGELVQDQLSHKPGAFVYPESLIADAPMPDRDGLAVAQTDVRVLALRSDDFRELCDDDDSELGEALLEALAQTIVSKRARLAVRRPGSEPEQGETADRARRESQRLAPVVAASIPNPRTLTPQRVQIPRSVTPQALAVSRAVTPRAIQIPKFSGLAARAATDPALPVLVVPALPAPAPVAPPIPAPAIGRTTTRAATDPGRVAIPAPLPARRESDAAAEVTAVAPAPAPVAPAAARTITEPEIETIVELEADAPGERDGKRRAITADDSVTASGTIEHDEPPPRSKRLSEGWGDD